MSDAREIPRERPLSTSGLRPSERCAGPPTGAGPSAPGAY